MSDPALESHPESITMLQEWGTYPAISPSEIASRREYVARDLERLANEGVAPLYAAVTLPVAGQQDEAIAAIAENDGTVYLRLVKGCSPPLRDPQGRELPANKQGKTLSVKVGNIGIESGSMRGERASRNGPLYRLAEVTTDVRAFQVAEAVTIMRQWGYRVQPIEKTEIGGKPQSRWLVVQVQADGKPFGKDSVEPAIEDAPKRKL